MKRIFILLSFAFVAIGLTSCYFYAEPTNPTEINEYYVRYSIQSSWYKFGGVSYADIAGTSYDLSATYANSWTITIGPVKKGFKAWSKNSMGTNTNSAKHTIEVSKNGGPFAQKATGVNNASYTINY